MTTASTTTQRTNGARRKSEATRQRILDAAARTFRAHGYAGARLADIAAAAGTKAGSLYYHFESREALVEEVLDRGIDRVFAAVRERLAALPPGASPRDRLDAAITAHLETALEVEAYTSASIRIFGQVPEAVRTRHLTRQRAYGAFWRGLLEEATAAGALRPGVDLSVARMLILGMLNWAPEWYRAGRLTPAEVARQAADLALDGLLARPGD